MTVDGADTTISGGFEVAGPAGALTLDGADRGRDRGDRPAPWNIASPLLTSIDRDHRDDRDQGCRNGSGLTVRGGNSTGNGGAPRCCR
ncbi:hypothetical protein OHB49_25095 [Streptomyces sp. NBC_01717]|uniref:hypothetical protein n=1 Tax=Streptomyces sp. NBC_01717 TaxID=2975918 RepID=UPI002E342ADE|nr:hypothetical protein [Streptomyces sp. NBC_01717]